MSSSKQIQGIYRIVKIVRSLLVQCVYLIVQSDVSQMNGLGKQSVVHHSVEEQV